MKAIKLQAFLLAILFGLVGCSSQQDSSVVKAKPDSSTAVNEPHPAHEDHAVQSKEHHQPDHRHAFADPEKLAAKWNDPARDEWQHPDEIVAALMLEAGQTVADIGAGTGYMVAHLSKAVGEDGTVIAIDAEAAMIEYLAKHLLELGPANIVTQKVGFHDPELKPESVDGVLTLDTWHHMAEREAYARKVFDGLRKGGRFAIIDYSLDAEAGPPRSMRLEPSDVVSQLESAGFQAEIVTESMPRHYIVVGVKN
jgi:predicted methyltransferase